MFRMLALIAGWSHDYWADINHGDAEIREQDGGPDHHRLVLVRSWNDAPSPSDVAGEIAFLTKLYLPHADGHAELHSHRVLDERQWNDTVPFLSITVDRGVTEENVAGSRFLDQRWWPICLEDDLLLSEALYVLNAAEPSTAAACRVNSFTAAG